MKIRALPLLTALLLLVSSGALSSYPIYTLPADVHLPSEIIARLPIRFRGVTPQLQSSPSGYTPMQIRHAYGFDQLVGDGTGQTIALIEAYGSNSLQADLDTFSTTYGLKKTTVSIYYPQGKPVFVDSDWALETSLDVQWAHAIAPGAKLVVVVSRSGTINGLLTAVDYAVNLGIKQISMSWGSSEYSGQLRADTHFNISGVAFFASSGDDGSGVLWPSTSPSVVSVGGTSLKLNPQGSITSETSWNGSGGGTSAYESRPLFQYGWQTSTKRAIPDVSYDADPATGFPVYISSYYNKRGWMTVGGTSAGAPQWAALWALVNAGRTTPSASAATAIYRVASSSYGTAFRDILTGTNGGYKAYKSYDLVTGLGSPVANALVPALTAP
jgi:subtilase family serine protease